MSEQTASGSAAPPLFGTMLTAMITPFDAHGALDLAGAVRVAEYLVDEQANDGLVVSGTTGESATTSDAEKEALLRAVIKAVGDRATIIAGVGTNDTEHSIELARAAEAAGADALLAVTPYYNKPSQRGVARHFTAIADSTGLPVMLYDIPGRSAIPIETQTLIALADHPRIVAVKDAKGDVEAATRVLRATDLQWYSGEDGLNLALLAVGGSGFVSVTGHVVGARIAEMAAAYRAGRVEEATALNLSMVPVAEGLFRSPAVPLVKAAYAEMGLPSGPVRGPLADADADEIAQLRVDLAAGGVPGFAA